MSKDDALARPSESEDLLRPLSPKSPSTENLADLKRAAANADVSKSPAQSGLLPIAAYCGASIMMTVVNKFVVSGKGFNMTCLILALQSLVCTSVVFGCKSIGLINLRSLDSETVKKWFPVSFMLASVIYTGSKSLQYLSIPVYTIFKNLTIILIAYGEVVWFGGSVTRLTLLSFFFMVLSSIIAAWSDISSTYERVITTSWDSTTGYPVSLSMSQLHGGYIWMFLNCVLQASYVLSMRGRIKSMGFKDWDTMFYNNALSIPVLIVFSLIVEDWSKANLLVNFPPETRAVLLFVTAYSGAAAVGISYTTAWCIRATSSTTYSMVGALNKLPVAASGMVFFGDPVSLGSVSAIGTGFFAGLVYAAAKNNQSKAEKAASSSLATGVSGGGPKEGLIPLHVRRAP